MITVDHDGDTRLTTLSRYQQAGFMSAQELWEREGIAAKCPAVYRVGHKTRKRPVAGERCWSPAGKGTDHVGVGRCVAHGGAKREGRAESGWLMAHAYAQEYDVSPWEALLLVIRITAGKLRYIESVLATAQDDRELEGRMSVEGEPMGVTESGDLTTGRNLSWWVEQSQLERQTLAKVSKAAIDAGVAQLLIEKELRAGEDLAQTFVRALEEMERAGMPDDMLDIARGVMRGQLQLALGAGSEGGDK